MSQPAVTITELDGALGVLPASSGDLLAFVGPATSGPIDTPATFARSRDVVSSYGAGPTVEAAAYYIERYGRPVVFVRSAASNPGALGVLDDADFAGTSVVTLDVAGLPNDDYEIELRFVTGGTIGVAGITLRYSLDGGRTLSPIVALGTAVAYVVPGSGGVEFEFAAGTVVAGDVLRVRTTAPSSNAADFTAALTALRASQVQWELAHVVGPLDPTIAAAVDAAFDAMEAAGKFRAWIGSARLPTEGETEAAYLSALSAQWSSYETTRGNLCAGACDLASGVSGRSYRRPFAFAVAAREASVQQHINTADTELGSLPGCSIRDSLGNPKHHDESVNPGLDDARFTVARTWDDLAGVYVNRSRTFCPEGSDFTLFTRRRVLNLFDRTLLIELRRRLNKPIVVNATTGFILEEEAVDIEAVVRAGLRSAMLATPKASAIAFTLSRTDNVLSTNELTFDARCTPLAYAESIRGDVGFINPARVASV